MCSDIPTSSADTSYVNGALCLARRIDHYILPRDEQTDIIAAPRLLIVQLVLLRHKRKILLDNVIKLSKNGAHKKYPPRKIEVGIFCFDK